MWSREPQDWAQQWMPLELSRLGQMLELLWVPLLSSVQCGTTRDDLCNPLRLGHSLNVCLFISQNEKVSFDLSISFARETASQRQSKCLTSELRSLSARAFPTHEVGGFVERPQLTPAARQWSIRAPSISSEIARYPLFLNILKLCYLLPICRCTCSGYSRLKFKSCLDPMTLSSFLSLLSFEVKCLHFLLLNSSLYGVCLHHSTSAAFAKFPSGCNL